MSAKHADPDYRKHARIIRQQVAKARRANHEVRCWRCGGEIGEEQTYDVGHIDPAGGHALSNLAPEHRYKQGHCLGNRAAGGRLGHTTRSTNTATTKGLLRW
ncbi:MAG TPA: hypothetical protein VFU07_09700 [Candidatus Lumbricidophila sp.]|nr:hypothetical protein [Candidatus Lumbricidophila sp.]